MSFFHNQLLNLGNIYQIFAYVNNFDFDGIISGTLVYASWVDDIDYWFKINGRLVMLSLLI